MNYSRTVRDRQSVWQLLPPAVTPENRQAALWWLDQFAPDNVLL